MAFGYGMLITPTCDMADQQGAGRPAHPYRVLVPVLPLRVVSERTGAVAENEKLLRSRDSIHPHMYFPRLPGALEEESVACLFRPSLVSDELIADPPRRIAQLHRWPAATSRSNSRRIPRVAVDPAELPLTERDKDAVGASTSPASRYDAIAP